MNGKKKKPTPKLQLESGPAEAKKPDRTISDSNLYPTMHSKKYPQGFVSSVLLFGKENAMPGAELVRLLGLKNGRELTQHVERERRAGVPICASVDSHKPGYYLAANPGELEKYISSLGRRIHQVSITKKHCEDTLFRWRGGDAE